jgi:outer membrane protein assembly factor BamB
MLNKVFLTASIAATATLAFSQAPADWTFSRANPQMTGISPTKLTLPLKPAWTFASIPNLKGKSEMMVASAVVRKGKVYVGNKEGKFFCLELTTGKKLWESSAPKGSFEGAAGFSGDLVIAGSTDSFVYSWNAETGVPNWKFETQGEIHAGINIWTDPATKQERVLIGSYDNNLYCLNAKDGTKIWAAETGNYINGGCAVSTDGKVALGGCDAVLHVLDVKDGKELRQIDVGAYIGNNVAVDAGIAYVTHYGNRVAAYSLNDGARLWEYGERDFEYYAAVALYDKIAVVGGRDKRLHGIDRVTGKGLWEYKCAKSIDSSAVICGGKHAVFGSDDGKLYVIDITDGKEAWSTQIGAAVKTSPAVAGDWIIVGADDGVVYAFQNGAATK